ncbi:MAG: hypothetical protein CMJ83_11880 [Planctomycetes bacterium]|nr:hypothetical protein [Planctomycetota bacterium]
MKGKTTLIAASALTAVLIATIITTSEKAGGMEFVNANTPVPAVGTEGGPAFPLSAQELDTWIRGRRVFDRDFHLDDGLGLPEFNGDSCRSCHQAPAIGGGGGLDLNVSRFGNDNGGAGPFNNLPGGQLAHRFRRVDVPGREEYDPMTADVFEQRQTPSLLGLGLIELIPEAEILMNEDPMDLNGDGVFGYARMIDVGGGVMELGRFGWKCGVPNLEDFSKDAASNELGITVADAARGFGFTTDADGITDPEFVQGDLDDMVFYLRNLAAPPRMASTSALVALGEMLFTTIGCATCHVPTLQSTMGPISPYSNFLLHNTSPPGFRGMEETNAPAGFYRTAPLWGISRTAPYMHDGLAETLEDAILAHDTEALAARNAFNAFGGADRAALIAFLEDL